MSEASVYIESTHTSCKWCAQRMLLDMQASPPSSDPGGCPGRPRQMMCNNLAGALWSIAKVPCSACKAIGRSSGVDSVEPPLKAVCWAVPLTPGGSLSPELTGSLRTCCALFGRNLRQKPPRAGRNDLIKSNIQCRLERQLFRSETPYPERKPYISVNYMLCTIASRLPVQTATNRQAGDRRDAQLRFPGSPGQGTPARPGCVRSLRL